MVKKWGNRDKSQGCGTRTKPKGNTRIPLPDTHPFNHDSSPNIQPSCLFESSLPSTILTVATQEPVSTSSQSPSATFTLKPHSWNINEIVSNEGMRAKYAHHHYPSNPQAESSTLWDEPPASQTSRRCSLFGCEQVNSGMHLRRRRSATGYTFVSLRGCCRLLDRMIRFYARDCKRWKGSRSDILSHALAPRKDQYGFQTKIISLVPKLWKQPWFQFNEQFRQMPTAQKSVTPDYMTDWP